MNPTIDETLKESTRVAREAADVANLTFTPRAEPITPVVLPEPIVSTASSALDTNITENARLSNKLTQDRQERQDIAATSESNLVNTMQDIINVTGSRVQAEEDAGIPGLSEEVTEIRNQIEAKQLSIRRAIEQREKNVEGTFGGAIAQDVAKIQREGTRELADLAIVESARLRSFQTAQNMVDKKIQLQLEPLQQLIEFQKFFFDQNQDQFNKAEEREFKNLIQNEQRNFDAEESRLKTLEGTKLQLLQSASAQDAPIGVLQSIQSSETPQAAIVAAGQFGGDVLGTQIKLEQLRQQQLQTRTTEAKIEASRIAQENGVYTEDQSSAVDDLTDQLRKEPSYKEMFEVRAGYNTANVGFNQNSGFGDIAMVNGYQRMIDPGATVRGEDIKTQAEAVAYMQTVFNIPGRITAGDRFTSDTRVLLNQAVQDQYTNRVDEFNSTTKVRYEDMIKRNPFLSTIDVDFNNIGDTFAATEDGVVEDIDPNETKIGEEINIGGTTYIKVGIDEYQEK